MPSDLADALRKQTAQAAGTTPDDVRVVSVSEVTWADSALGCGGPQESALQVLTPGYRVVLEARGALYAYHADRRGNFRLCPTGRSETATPAPDAPVDR